MAVQPVLEPSHGRHVPIAEALGMAPVLITLGLLLWLTLARGLEQGEAVPERTQLGPALAGPAVGSNPPGQRLLIVLTASEEMAADIRALLEAEAALRELLLEESRNAQVVATASDDEAVLIADAIRADEALRVPQVEVVILR